MRARIESKQNTSEAANVFRRLSGAYKLDRLEKLNEN
jgi:hypothetical protein